MHAFQNSLPNRYAGPKDGILIILFPIVGAVAALIGYQVTQRLAQQSDLCNLRALSITVLVLALLTNCPIGVGFYDVQINRGRIRLEWGFYGSLLASAAIAWAGWDLLHATKQAAPVIDRRACPSCGAEATRDQRFCMTCGAAVRPPDPPRDEGVGAENV